MKNMIMQMYPIIIPMSSGGHSGPWTDKDTKILIAITIFLVFTVLISFILDVFNSGHKGRRLKRAKEILIIPFESNFIFAMSYIFLSIEIICLIIHGIYLML